LTDLLHFAGKNENILRPLFSFGNFFFLPFFNQSPFLGFGYGSHFSPLFQPVRDKKQILRPLPGKFDESSFDMRNLNVPFLNCPIVRAVFSLTLFYIRFKAGSFGLLMGI